MRISHPPAIHKKIAKSAGRTSSHISGFDVIFGSPYGIAVPPYGHTPDASPHTFWQILIGRPFSHTAHQIPHSHAISPYDPQAPKSRFSFRRDQRVQFHISPTNPVKQTPWTCVTVQQTKSQPVPANHLRYCTTNQSPTGSSK